MKTCSKCGNSKLQSEFYAHPKTLDGFSGRCKVCTRALVTANRDANLERIRAYDRQRYRDRPERQEQVRLWGESRTPEARRAHSAVSNAIRDGRLKRPKHCSSCDEAVPLNAHHEDYSKPLEVVWLCLGCHRRHHRETRSRR